MVDSHSCLPPSDWPATVAGRHMSFPIILDWAASHGLGEAARWLAEQGRYTPDDIVLKDSGVCPPAQLRQSVATLVATVGKAAASRHGVSREGLQAAFIALEFDTTEVKPHSRGQSSGGPGPAGRQATGGGAGIRALPRTGAPPTGPARADLPAVYRSGGKQLGPPDLEEIASLENDVYANSAKGPRLAREKTWNTLARQCGRDPLPLDKGLVTMMGAAFKAARYRSTKIHFQEAVHRHISQGFGSLQADLALHIKNTVRSATRGLTTPARKPSFRFEAFGKEIQLVKQSLKETHSVTKREDFHLLAISLGTWFLARGMEMAGALRQDLEVDLALGTVSWFLPVSKTDPRGTGTRRCLPCTCEGPRHLFGDIDIRRALCPVHLADTLLGVRRRLLPQADAENPEKALFDDGTGMLIFRPTLKKAIRATAERAGTDRQVAQRLGEHAMRVSGAQFLTRLGVPLNTIKTLGRWQSDTVSRYVQDSPLERVALFEQAEGLGPQPPQGRPAPLADTPSGEEARESATPLSAGPIPKRPRAEASLLPGQGRPPGPDDAEVRKLSTLVQDLQKAVQDLLEARRWVLNVKTDTYHLPDPAEQTRPPNSWRTPCGWAYGRTFFQHRAAPPPEYRPCRCVPAHCRPQGPPPDSSSSEESSTCDA